MLTIAEILRASHVKRWNIVATTREQSVAEHSFNVCMIVRALCKRLQIPDEELIKAALEHDLDEIVFGDIPSPLKRKMLANGVDMNSYASNKMRDLTEFQWGILKVADLADAILFLRDHKIGKHGDEVLADVNNRLVEHIATCSCNATTIVEVKKFLSELL